MVDDPEQQGSSKSPGGDEAGRGFRQRKREDHALLLIEELKDSLSDLSRVKRILLELGRFYDPVLGGAIMEISHQQGIVEALEAGRQTEAEAIIDARYELYIRDRAHLGRPDA